VEELVIRRKANLFNIQKCYRHAYAPEQSWQAQAREPEQRPVARAAEHFAQAPCAALLLQPWSSVLVSQQLVAVPFASAWLLPCVRAQTALEHEVERE
jgi:hypothetical protein